MTRYIDADELKDHQFHGCYTNIHIASNTDAYMLGWNDAIDAIVECAPTVDPVKHGHWEVNPHDRAYDICSVCGIGSKRREYGTNPDGNEYVTEWSWDYCPNCGSRMDERKENRK